MSAAAAAPSSRDTHRRAVLALVGATLLWSVAGVVTRHLHHADGLQLVFWRSGFAALAVALVLLTRDGAPALLRTVRDGAAPLWTSALLWCVMYTAFMLALSLTTVAQTLVVDSLSPLCAALLGRVLLRQRLPTRTWGAIAVASAGMLWMCWHDVHAARSSRELLGLLVALCVPLAAAGNWVNMRRSAGHGALQAAPMFGAALSALLVALPAGALAVDAHDLAWLAFLGVFQLALPGILAVWAAQRLLPAEVGLLGLLEVVFGTAWAWLGAGERPTSATLGGGALILGALLANEMLGWWRAPLARRRAA